ncbi:MBL fold metallo-hydrolase [Microvirga tunisiensis]|uniref:MBL fold metallo-hydrolase n=2 Tax=Pannonibacter tanglangensis TaxID=2750084 RepID=A0ABW9ZDU4_9HYPH|nr:MULTISPECIES: MBL fold metallo-hydrolase [unclassified Pannonibacter]NBN62656.1 MBL fold metallo-hydrolase [Pannonibacter sp. XCT-34]NBN78311.1 MBL fold metallo-hydrolase [Pannonibacter sp. XCT-53]
MSKTTSGADTDSVTIAEVGRGCFALSRPGRPTVGVIRAEDSLVLVDAPPSRDDATPLLEALERLSDRPVKHLVLTHYHARRIMGAPALVPGEIIASDLTRRMIDERGRHDLDCEHAARLRVPQGPQRAAFAQGLPVHPTMTFASSLSLRLGSREVRLMHLGRGHTMGDVVVYVPDSGVMFAGDLLEPGGCPDTRDGHLADWLRTLERMRAFRANAVIAGSGPAIVGPTQVGEALTRTRDYLDTLLGTARACVVEELPLKEAHAAIRDAMDPRFGRLAFYEARMPFNVVRALEEARGQDLPQVWTAERDRHIFTELGSGAAASNAA